MNDITRKTQSFSIPKGDIEKAKAGHFTCDLYLTADAQTSFVSVGVYDEVSHEYGLTRADLAGQVRHAGEAR